MLYNVVILALYESYLYEFLCCSKKLATRKKTNICAGFDPLVGAPPPFLGAVTKIVRQIEGGTRKRGHIYPLLPTEPTITILYYV